MPPKASSDSALWRQAMRDVKPIAAQPAPPAAKPAAAVSLTGRLPAPSLPAPLVPAPLVPALASPPPALDRFAGIDRANAERLKRGKHRVEARLDLHGMTQAEAHRALAQFIRTARAGGKRCVLVITGRGAPKGLGGTEGVLRAAVPRWLDEPEFRAHLLAIATAQPRDGGAGALYVMLRRTRAGQGGQREEPWRNAES